MNILGTAIWLRLIPFLLTIALLASVSAPVTSAWSSPPPLREASHPLHSDSVAGDRAALVILYNATGGANWTNNSGWLSAAPLDQWHGVTTDAEGRVSTLDLRNNGLSGEIPEELGSLTNLTKLYLQGNQLSGQIPSELGSLTNLTWLVLSGNQLSGKIPSELGGLTNLTHLYLSENQLSREIPEELGSLTNLTYLNLRSNQLTGPIPAELGSLTNLTHLYLWDSELSGTIPGATGQPHQPGNVGTFPEPVERDHPN